MEYRFETDRLVLRPRNLSDLEACLQMDRDKEVAKYIPGPWKNPEEHKQFVLERINREYPEGLGYWSLFRKEDPDTFSGWILLLPYPHFGSEIEIGWRLNKRCWGRGYATEAASAILNHALSLPRVVTVVADIHPENIASIKVAEKIGLKYTQDRVLYNQMVKSYQILQQ